MVQGDTTSGFCAALAAFHRRIAVAHVEAGLRSGDRQQPFPEEVNRRMVAVVADLHLAPTEAAAVNLRREGVDPDAVHVTGNTTVDTLLAVLGLEGGGAPPARTPQVAGLGCSGAGADLTPPCPPLSLAGEGGEASASREAAAEEGGAERERVLITLHRRESWLRPTDGGTVTPLEGLFGAIADSARAHPNVDFLYPVHRNPAVWVPAHRLLGGLPNVTLSAPLPYLRFVHEMARSRVILSDSGGVQEEAPSLGVPVLVLREVTERPEAIDAGLNVLVGTDPAVLRVHLNRQLSRPASAPRPLPCPNPYGDGLAAFRVRDALLYHSGLGPRPAGFSPALAGSEPDHTSQGAP